MFGEFRIVKACATTNARVSTFRLSKNTLHLPVFMPVATYGAMRGVQLAHLEEEIILSNTYHLRSLGRNIKNLMGWERSMLTDSGGFQIQSLPNVKVVDEGVVFDGRLFTPEDSMDIQMGLGADIMMQLDDVVNPMMSRELHECAIRRSIEWLDRAIVHINRTCEEEQRSTAGSSSGVECSSGDNGLGLSGAGSIGLCGKARMSDPGAGDTVRRDSADVSFADSDVKRAKTSSDVGSTDGIVPRSDIPVIKCHNGQVIFPIVQGGLEDDLRVQSIEEILRRKPIGLAIGGLSGGENKNDFCRTVYNCCRNLPPGMPRYLMGVGYPEDVVVCSALGTDMSDCVYPTRTARFGRAFSDSGDLTISNALLTDLQPISWDCGCATCKKYSRAYLATIKGTPMFCMLMSAHNLYYMRKLTRRIRTHILNDTFPSFVKDYMRTRYGDAIPDWIVAALKLVNVDLSSRDN